MIQPTLNNYYARTSDSRDDWNTPESFLTHVRKMGEVGLDPCSNAQSTVGAHTAWTIDDDGLKRAWNDHGLVFVNPPYGHALKVWSIKIERESARGAEIITLVPAKTETGWFNRIRKSSDLVAFMPRRIAFVGGVHGSTFPSAVFYRGPRPGEFKDAFSDAWIVPCR